jgi:hypothetical protein
MLHLPHYHSENYPREYNTDAFYQKIIDGVTNKMGRPLMSTEREQTIRFIQKMDPDLLAPRYQSQTINIMISTLTKEFKKFDCIKPEFLDTQERLRQTIGITSETGTVHSVYDNPSYQLNRAEPDTVADEPLDIKSLITNDAITKKITKPQTSQQPMQPQQQPIQSIIDNMLGITNADEAVRILNPASLLRKNYLMLDSRYRVLENDVDGKISSFKWNYILQSQASAQGTVNVVGNVRDIVALRVYPFRIPYIDSADNKYSRISVHIDEFSQSFIAHENRKFQFMLQSEIDGAFINLLTDEYNDGFFYFEQPVPEITTLTVSFGSPMEPVLFDRDRDDCQIDYFSIAPLTKITTGKPGFLNKHNLSNGDRVYFSNFNVGPVTLPLQNIENQKIKSDINKPSGYLVTVIDEFSFSINYNSSNIQNPLPDPLAVPHFDIFVFQVFYGSKRLFLPIELTYIMPEPGRDGV